MAVHRDHLYIPCLGRRPHSGMGVFDQYRYISRESIQRLPNRTMILRSRPNSWLRQKFQTSPSDTPTVRNTAPPLYKSVRVAKPVPSGNRDPKGMKPVYHQNNSSSCQLRKKG